MMIGRAATGLSPAPGRGQTTWATFLRSPAEALRACDFFETRTLSGARLHVFAVIGHATRRIRILGATAHPTAAWATQLAPVHERYTEGALLSRELPGSAAGRRDQTPALLARACHQ